ncbi:MAG: phage portal protein [bacterium]|nr:phage portal protein [bacterium]
MKATINLLAKQTKAWNYWEDNITTELGYGGAAGGGKTRLGCYIEIAASEQYPKSRWAIGRKELKTLRLTTLTTLFEIFNELGYKNGLDFKYNSQEGVITFANGSQILILDTAYSPQDPEYTRFGSLELTGCWIDESNETPEKAKSILKTRVGRKNKFGESEVKSFWLETFNPNKGHVYRDYWKPFKEGTLPKYRQFIRALPNDNPYLPDAYIQNLKRADKITRERLLLGNFDFDDNPQKIMSYQSILDLPDNVLVGDHSIKRMIADIARFGGDKIVLAFFRGMELYGLGVYTYQGIDETIRKMKSEASIEKIGFTNILADEGGLGGGVVDGMRGIKGFNGNSSPTKIHDPIKNALIPSNYQNLRCQCYFKLAETVNEHNFRIDVTKFDTNIEGYTKEQALSDLIEELDVIQETDRSQDSKRAIIPKSEIKELLGRSPDFADIAMMRMFYEIQEPEEIIVNPFKKQIHIIKQNSNK